LESFSGNLSILEKTYSPGTRRKLFERIRHQLPDLPQGDMSEGIRDAIMKLLNIMGGDFGHAEMRELFLDMFSIICCKRDKEVNKEMKELFLNKIIAMCPDLGINEKSDALTIIQQLHKYSPVIMEELMNCAIEKWSKEEFNKLLIRIDFGRLSTKDKSVLREKLWDRRSKAEETGQVEKIRRIDRILDLYAFQ